MIRRIAVLALVLAGCSGSSDGPSGAVQRGASPDGAICGDPAIRGMAIGRVPGASAGCGVGNAVRVSSINGVVFSQSAVIECGTAKAIKTWMDRGMNPVVGKAGGGVASIRVAAHYACRTRNSQKGARISEHAKGRAIDISGFKLRDGTMISVKDHWGSGRYGRMLKKMHAKACGPFGTVLGPNADRHHHDHFHFDTAQYRSGAYCR